MRKTAGDIEREKEIKKGAQQTKLKLYQNHLENNETIRREKERSKW